MKSGILDTWTLGKGGTPEKAIFRGRRASGVAFTSNGKPMRNEMHLVTDTVTASSRSTMQHCAWFMNSPTARVCAGSKSTQPRLTPLHEANAKTTNQSSVCSTLPRTGPNSRTHTLRQRAALACSASTSPAVFRKTKFRSERTKAHDQRRRNAGREGARRCGATHQGVHRDVAQVRFAIASLLVSMAVGIRRGTFA